jgi:5-methylcytosine-specific restriction endonuclease McrA
MSFVSAQLLLSFLHLPGKIIGSCRFGTLIFIVSEQGRDVRFSMKKRADQQSFAKVRRCINSTIKKQVLLLDQGFQPVKIIRWQKAMQLLISGKAELVVEYPDTPIRSVKHEWKLPSVLRMRGMTPRARTVNLTRDNIYFRDRYCCQYCGRQKKQRELTIDHVIPICKDGGRSWSNLVSACFPCNQKKGGRTPAEAGMPLLKKLVEPEWAISYAIKIIEPRNIPETWTFYVRTPAFAIE